MSNMQNNENNVKNNAAAAKTEQARKDARAPQQKQDPGTKAGTDTRTPQQK
ncbi:MAG: hypothetical protein ABW278_07860 [Steroidobacteraceae bacterium]